VFVGEDDNGGGVARPALMRLDHVLVSPGVEVQAIREGVGQGSNHRPIIADLVLLP
jgi:endonuclease/exonuclease/phosphatase (EEP) superfamily protein YafD